MDSIPVVDVSALRSIAENSKCADAAPHVSDEVAAIARAIGNACRDFGFFYVTGHGVSRSLQDSLESLSRQFFGLPLPQKMKIRMELGGRAWRGYFPVGNELTSGKPDQKEGIYFGEELRNDHPLAAAEVPLHGPNLFPEIAEFKQTVLAWLQQMTLLGHTLMKGIAISLGLNETFFHDHYTHDPLILFRVFHYPPLANSEDHLWSVGEHTDYGLLTILKQDSTGGLQIKSKSQWIDAPVIDNSFVCNLGDMLDRMTGSLYQSTPHRVRNSSGQGRLSFPFFFDPNWNAVVKPIEGIEAASNERRERWDGANLHDWNGTYGDYVLGKVSKVFPDLKRRTSE